MCIVLVVLQARRYPQSVEVRGRLYNRGRLFPEQKRLLWRRLKEQLSGREWKWSLPMTETDVWTRSGLENTRKDSARWRQQYAFFQMRGEVITRLITEYDFLVRPLTTSWLASQMKSVLVHLSLRMKSNDVPYRPIEISSYDQSYWNETVRNELAEIVARLAVMEIVIGKLPNRVQTKLQRARKLVDPCVSSSDAN